MIKKTLKLSTALMLGLATLSSLKATDLIQDPQMDSIIRNIVHYENNPQMFEIKTKMPKLMAIFGAGLGCDMPILESMHFVVKKPSQQNVIDFLRFVKKVNANEPFQIEALDADKNHAINELAKAIFLDDGSLKDKAIDLRGKNLTVVPHLIKYLTNITQISFEGNNLTDVTPLSHLVNLQYLYLSSNQIGDVTPLGNLKNLGFLSISHNHINDFSPLENASNLTSVFIYDNPGVDTLEKEEEVLKYFSPQTYLTFAPQTEDNLQGRVSMGTRGLSE